MLTCFFASCTRDDDPCDGHPSKTETYYVSAQTKSKSPYSGYEVLIFTSDKGDTAILSGNGKKVNFTSRSDYSTGNPDCGNLDYWYSETIEYNFSGINPVFNRFKYIQIGGEYFITISDKDYIGLNIYAGNNNISVAALAEQVYDPARYKDSLVIGNNSIKAIKFHNGIFYNEKYGMVRFTDTLSKKIWTIKLP